jgi:hypothetical protein
MFSFTRNAMRSYGKARSEIMGEKMGGGFDLYRAVTSDLPQIKDIALDVFKTAKENVWDGVIKKAVENTARGLTTGNLMRTDKEMDEEFAAALGDMSFDFDAAGGMGEEPEMGAPRTSRPRPAMINIIGQRGDSRTQFDPYARAAQVVSTKMNVASGKAMHAAMMNTNRILGAVAEYSKMNADATMSEARASNEFRMNAQSTMSAMLVQLQEINRAQQIQLGILGRGIDGAVLSAAGCLTSKYDRSFSEWGDLSPVNYARTVAANIKDALSDVDMMKEMVSAPLELMMKGMADKMMPKMIDMSITRMGKIFGDLPAALGFKMEDWQRDQSPIKQFFGRILGHESRGRSSWESKLGSYEKGAVSYDGVTKKAIVEVIPKYLAMILNQLKTGGAASEELLFDYDKGMLRKRGDVISDYNKSRMGSTHETEIGSKMKSGLMARHTFDSREKEQEFSQTINRMMSMMAMQQGNFKGVIQGARTPMEKQIASEIQRQWKSMGGSEKFALDRARMGARMKSEDGVGALVGDSAEGSATRMALSSTPHGKTVTEGELEGKIDQIRRDLERNAAKNSVQTRVALGRQMRQLEDQLDNERRVRSVGHLDADTDISSPSGRASRRGRAGGRAAAAAQPRGEMAGVTVNDSAELWTSEEARDEMGRAAERSLAPLFDRVVKAAHPSNIFKMVMNPMGAMATGMNHLGDKLTEWVYGSKDGGATDADKRVGILGRMRDTVRGAFLGADGKGIASPDGKGGGMLGWFRHHMGRFTGWMKGVWGNVWNGADGKSGIGGAIKAQWKRASDWVHDSTKTIREWAFNTWTTFKEGLFGEGGFFGKGGAVDRNIIGPMREKIFEPIKARMLHAFGDDGIFGKAKAAGGDFMKKSFLGRDGKDRGMAKGGTALAGAGMGYHMMGPIGGIAGGIVGGYLGEQFFKAGGLFDKRGVLMQKFTDRVWEPFKNWTKKYYESFTARVVDPSIKFLQDKIWSPFKETMSRDWQRVKAWTSENLIKPMKGVLDPFRNEMSFQFNRFKIWMKEDVLGTAKLVARDLMARVGQTGDRMFNKLFGITLTESLNKFKEETGKLLGRIIKAPFNFITNISRKLRDKHSGQGLTDEGGRYIEDLGATMRESIHGARAGEQLTPEQLQAQGKERAFWERAQQWQNAEDDARMMDAAAAKNRATTASPSRPSASAAAPSATAAAAAPPSAAEVSNQAPEGPASVASAPESSATAAASPPPIPTIQPKASATASAAAAASPPPIPTIQPKAKGTPAAASTAAPTGPGWQAMIDTSKTVSSIYSFMQSNMGGLSRNVHNIARHLGVKDLGEAGAGKYGGLFGDIMAKMKGLVMAPVNFVMSGVRRVTDAVLAVPRKLLGLANNLARGAAEVAKGVWGVVTGVGKAAGYILDHTLPLMGDALRGVGRGLAKVGGALMDGVGAVVRGIGKAIAFIGPDLWGAAKEVVSTAWAAAKYVIGGGVKALLGNLDKLAVGVANVVVGLGKATAWMMRQGWNATKAVGRFVGRGLGWIPGGSGAGGMSEVSVIDVRRGAYHDPVPVTIVGQNGAIMVSSGGSGGAGSPGSTAEPGEPGGAGGSFMDQARQRVSGAAASARKRMDDLMLKYTGTSSRVLGDWFKQSKGIWSKVMGWLPLIGGAIMSAASWVGSLFTYFTGYKAMSVLGGIPGIGKLKSMMPSIPGFGRRGAGADRSSGGWGGPSFDGDDGSDITDTVSDIQDLIGDDGPGKAGGKAGGRMSRMKNSVKGKFGKVFGRGGRLGKIGGMFGKLGGKAGGIGRLFSGATRMAGSAGLLGKAGGFLGKLGSKIPIAGGLIAGGTSLMAGEGVSTAAGHGIGTAAGAAIGAGIGSVIPVLGTAVGGLLGGIVGDWVGGKVGPMVGGALKSAGSWMSKKGSQLWEGAKKGASMVASGFHAAMDWSGKAISSAFSATKSAAKGLGKAALWAVKGYIGMMGRLIGGVGAVLGFPAKIGGKALGAIWEADKKVASFAIGKMIGVKDWAAARVTGIKDNLFGEQGLFGPKGKLFGDEGIFGKGGWMAKTWTGFSDIFKSVFGKGWDAVKGAWNTASGAVSSAASAVAGGVSGAYTATKDAASSAYQGAKKGMGAAGSWLGGLFGSAKDAAKRAGSAVYNKAADAGEVIGKAESATIDAVKSAGKYVANKSESFMTRVAEISQDLGIPDPKMLLAAMQFESRMSPNIRNKQSGATGLIQFMPSTARGLGTTTDALAQMSDVDQLEYVHKYLKPYKGKLKSASDLYMSILWPKAAGKGEDYPLFQKGTKAYAQNPLDWNKDGVVSKSEAASKMIDIYKSMGGSGAATASATGSAAPTTGGSSSTEGATGGSMIDKVMNATSSAAGKFYDATKDAVLATAPQASPKTGSFTDIMNATSSMAGKFYDATAPALLASAQTPSSIASASPTGPMEAAASGGAGGVASIVSNASVGSGGGGGDQVVALLQKIAENTGRAAVATEALAGRESGAAGSSQQQPGAPGSPGTIGPNGNVFTGAAPAQAAPRPDQMASAPPWFPSRIPDFVKNIARG